MTDDNCRALSEIEAEIASLRHRLGTLRTERRARRRRRTDRGHRRWTAEEEAPIRADWLAGLPLTAIEARHGLTRGQLLGLSYRRDWPARLALRAAARRSGT